MSTLFPVLKNVSFLSRWEPENIHSMCYWLDSIFEWRLFPKCNIFLLQSSRNSSAIKSIKHNFFVCALILVVVVVYYLGNIQKDTGAENF